MNIQSLISAGLEGPIPQEVNKVSLFKDPIYEDFGFSVSDGLYERGIYINRIRKGGPADESGLLKPFDRILQINQVTKIVLKTNIKRVPIRPGPRSSTAAWPCL